MVSLNELLKQKDLEIVQEYERRDGKRHAGAVIYRSARLGAEIRMYPVKTATQAAPTAETESELTAASRPRRDKHKAPSGQED